MKAHIRIIVLMIVLFRSFSYAQCTTDNILPFRHNITKFETIKKSKDLLGFVDSEQNKYSVSYKTFSDDFKDSVFKDVYYFDIKYSKCYTFVNATYSISFSDDKLYKQELKLDFSSDSLAECMKVYNKILSMYKVKYSVWEPFVTTNTNTGSQMGEGYWLKNYSGVIKKVKEVKVMYELEYKYFNEKKPPYKRIYTNQIDKYVIYVESVDLTETKLDNNGY